MADIKKFLDQAGVSTLWSKIAEELEAKQSAINAVDEKVGTNADKISTLEGKVEALENGAYDDTEVRGLIADNKAAHEANTTALEAVSAIANAAATNEALTTEVNRAKGEESRIEGLVITETNRATGIEAGLRADVDTIKEDYLKAADKTELTNAIKAEKERAEGAESNLQTQINTIMNNPDTEGVINSINEFTTYISEHGEIAEGFRTDIDANAKAIEDHVALAAEIYETKENATAKYNELTELVNTKAVQADWNENDETAPDYINNKPFYEIEKRETVLEETTFEVVNGRAENVISLSGYKYLGQTLTVTFDGVEYESVMTKDSEECYWLNFDTPQGQVKIYDGHTVYYNNNDGSHTIKIEKVAPEFKQLNEKFIPDSIARSSVTDTIGERINDASSIVASPTSWFITDGNGVITDFNKEEFTYDVERIVIPSKINGVTITSIGSNAFARRSNLTSIIIPDGVTSIGHSAFNQCTSLTSVNIPDSVTNISGAFSHCTSLTSVNIPDSVTNISGAFGHCTSLISITIPDSVTSIGEGTFGNCTSLTSVTIPDSVTSIGFSAFENCNNLTTVYYTGTEEQWDAININNNYERNTPLLNATKVFNCGTPIQKLPVVNSDDAGKILHVSEDGRWQLVENNNDFISNVENRVTTNEQAITALQDADTAITGRLDDIETALGTGEGSVSDQIADAKAEAISEAVSQATTAAAADATSKANAAETNAKAYADSLAVNYDAAGDAEKALADAKSYSDANLVTAKAHSDANLTTAKSYTDTEVAKIQALTPAEIDAAIASAKANA